MSRTHRMGLLLSLYLAQGLPYGFFALALPVLLREAGHSLTTISLLQFLALPWVLKFLWAGWLDHHGQRRTWLLIFQLAASALAFVLAWQELDPAAAGLLVAVAVFNLIAASQDIITDGLAVRMLDVHERGLANALQVGGYRLGMILGGGGLLWVYARHGSFWMFLGMAALLLLTTLPVWRLREPQRPAPAVVRAELGRGGIALAWLHRALTPGMLVFAALIFAYRFGDQMLSSLITPFLHDVGVSKEDIAVMKGTVGSVASLVGALAGGWLAFRTGRRWALLVSGLLQAAGFAIFVAAAMGWGGMPALWAGIVVEGLFGTMATVALFTLMMDASDPAHAGTDYTILASVVTLVSGLANVAGGVLGDLVGYTATFATATVLAAAGCIVLVVWLDRRPTSERLAQAWR